MRLIALKLWEVVMGGFKGMGSGAKKGKPFQKGRGGKRDSKAK